MVLLAVSAVVLFFHTQNLLKSEIEEELFSNKDRVERLLKDDQTIKGVPPIMTVEKVQNKEALKLKDTLIYDQLQDEIELFEELSEAKEINGEFYRITVRVMVIDSDDILFAIVATFVCIIFLAFIFLFYLNKTRNERLWKPFFVNLDRLKDFSLKSNTPLDLVNSEILEFHELNQELAILSNKIQADYHNLKQFTEDVSHEMKTPLAIMQARIETMINDPVITDGQFEDLSKLQSDISRLNQLNKKLIILAKIENDQFTATELVNINEVLKSAVLNYSELTNFSINIEEHDSLKVKMDKMLAVILFNNLLSNAVKYNLGNAPISIKIDSKAVEFTNSGLSVIEGSDHLFERFFKTGNRQDSTGLGLSIVKKICDYYGFDSSYRFRESEKLHSFTIDFKL
jgi:signal transduction histidine kinase